MVVQCGATDCYVRLCFVSKTIKTVEKYELNKKIGCRIYGHILVGLVYK